MEKVNLLAISGKAGSGKDSVGIIIQGLNMSLDYDMIIHQVQLGIPFNKSCGYKIVKFADSLKDIVCILTGCTRDQLEDIDFKNSKLSDDWINYKIGINKFTSKESLIKRYKEEHCIEPSEYWINSQLCNLTYRELLQITGTDLLRNQLHEDVWVNALFSKYKKDFIEYQCSETYPNWIVTDCRFPNEAKAVKDREGIVIRVNRDLVIGGEDYGFTKVSVKQAEKDGIIKPQHISETALDGYDFDWIIDNNGTIEDLIVKTKEMLEYYGTI